MKKYIFITLIVFSSLFLFSCKTDSNREEHPVLNVSTQDDDVSIFDIFEEIRIIPLESKEDTFFRYATKIEQFDDIIFVFDITLYALYIYDMDGGYINKIHRVGRGEGEYTLGYDFVVDANKNIIYLLNPQGSINTYNYDGEFINQINLPYPPYAYRYFELLNDGRFITWSSAFGEDENVINIINPESGEIENGFFYDSSIWGTFKSSTYFHKYGGDLYYHETLSNKVYRLTGDGYEIAYEWDTGIKKLIDPKKLKTSPGTANEDVYNIISDFTEGKIPFFFERQLQNDVYYYSMLRVDRERAKYLFFDKTTNTGFQFEKTTEGICPELEVLNEEFALGSLNDKDIPSLLKVVSPSDAELLNSRNTDDNPWLIKYILKKNGDL